MTIELALHTLVRFDYATTTSSAPLPVWMIQLIARNNFEFNMSDMKWYWQRTTIIHDGDYVVRIHPKMLELARLQIGEDPRVKDPTDVFLQTILGKVQGPEDVQWVDGFGYGIMQAASLDSLMRQDEILSVTINDAIESLYAAIDGRKETKQ